MLLFVWSRCLTVKRVFPAEQTHLEAPDWPTGQVPSKVWMPAAGQPLKTAGRGGVGIGKQNARLPGEAKEYGMQGLFCPNMRSCLSFGRVGLAVAAPWPITVPQRQNEAPFFLSRTIKGGSGFAWRRNGLCFSAMLGNGGPYALRPVRSFVHVVHSFKPRGSGRYG